MSNKDRNDNANHNDVTVTRRTALSMLVASAGASALPITLMSGGASAAVLQTTTVAQQVNVVANKEVVSFFMDMPYIDPTGLAKPYIPPAFTDRNYDAVVSQEAVTWAGYC